MMVLATRTTQQVNHESRKEKKQPWTSREYQSSKLMPIKKKLRKQGKLTRDVWLTTKQRASL